MPRKSTGQGAGSEQEKDFAELKQRFDSLSHEQTRIKAQQETVQNQLDEVKRQAREQFGTDDLDELKSRLKSMQSENEKQRVKYRSQLDKIEKQLADVETEFAASQNPND